MKIIITGHRSGIGKAVATLLSKKGHEIIGFDLTDGYDISEPNNLNNIVLQLNEADVFINNAYHPTAQTILLRKSIEAWKNTEKIIVHIGSMMALGKGKTLEHLEHLVTEYSQLPGPKYINVKREQMEIINAEFFNSTTKLIHIMLSATYTPMIVKPYLYPTLGVEKIAKIVDDLINQQKDCFIRQVIVSNITGD